MKILILFFLLSFNAFAFQFEYNFNGEKINIDINCDQYLSAKFAEGTDKLVVNQLRKRKEEDGQYFYQSAFNKETLQQNINTSKAYIIESNKLNGFALFSSLLLDDYNNNNQLSVSYGIHKEVSQNMEIFIEKQKIGVIDRTNYLEYKEDTVIGINYSRNLN
jgi:hypothetical protein